MQPMVILGTAPVFCPDHGHDGEERQMVQELQRGMMLCLFVCLVPDYMSFPWFLCDKVI